MWLRKLDVVPCVLLYANVGAPAGQCLHFKMNLLTPKHTDKLTKLYYAFTELSRHIWSHSAFASVLYIYESLSATPCASGTSAEASCVYCTAPCCLPYALTISYCVRTKIFGLYAAMALCTAFCLSDWLRRFTPIFRHAPAYSYNNQVAPLLKFNVKPAHYKPF